ncbi:MAG: hypothetical protein ROR55_07755 [Devosia sp.]
MKWLKPGPRKNGVVWVFCPPRGGKTTRMPDLPHDHPDFLIAYAAAVQAAEDSLTSGNAISGTLKAVAIAYKKSAAWRELRPSSREQRDRELGRLIEIGGHARVATVTARNVRKDIGKLTAGAASNRLRA